MEWDCYRTTQLRIEEQLTVHVINAFIVTATTTHGVIGPSPGLVFGEEHIIQSQSLANRAPENRVWVAPTHIPTRCSSRRFYSGVGTYCTFSCWKKRILGLNCVLK